MKNKLTAMETFVGAGGSYLGLKKAGFKTIYVNEIDKNFIKTLTYNNKKDLEKCIVDVRPIEEVNFQKLRNKLNIKKKKLDLIFGGPVCKGYSLAGVRDPSDIRNTLYRHQIRMIAEFLPKISIIENVPAMRTSLILKSGIEKEKLKEISHIWKQLDIFKGLKAKLTKKGKGFSKFELNNYNLIKSKKKKYENFVKNNSISVIDDISEMLAKLGYKIYIENLNAAWFGSYTKRVRTFVVAVRKDIKKEFIFPTITNFDYKTKLNGFNIVKDPKPFKTIKAK